MDDYKFNEVKDVRWESISPEDGNIKFRRNKKKSFFGRFLKAIIFIIIASISGGVSGAYVVNNIYNSNGGKYVIPQNNQGYIGDTLKSSNLYGSAINKIADNVGPAVVGVSNTGESFWGTVDKGAGSGIIFDSNGYIVTNYHVIEGAAKVTVKLSNGKVFPAKLVGYDKRSDIAVIKIEGTNLPTAIFGDSTKVRVGDLAVAIGNPLGEEFAGSVTAGIISALNRTMKYDGAIYKVLQTDAAINPGNSGGPLVNEDGEVIGINSLKIGSESNAEGMGFAIAINEAKTIIDALMNDGKVKRPALGVLGQTVSSRDGSIKGFYVNEVVEGSGAAAAGVKPTDIVIGIDNQKVESFEDLAEALDKRKIGDSVSCKIWRDGATVELTITLKEVKETNR